MKIIIFKIVAIQESVLRAETEPNGFSGGELAEDWVVLEWVGDEGRGWGVPSNHSNVTQL
jgi:hypothetical protein